MAIGKDNSLIRHLRGAAYLHDAGEMTDRQLPRRPRRRLLQGRRGRLLQGDLHCTAKYAAPGWSTLAQAPLQGKLLS